MLRRRTFIRSKNYQTLSVFKYKFFDMIRQLKKHKKEVIGRNKYYQWSRSNYNYGKNDF